MNKYDEMVVRITIFCREPLNFGLLEHFLAKNFADLQSEQALCKSSIFRCLISIGAV